jgi:hypothetical protein
MRDIGNFKIYTRKNIPRIVSSLNRRDEAIRSSISIRRDSDQTQRYADSRIRASNKDRPNIPAPPITETSKV